MPIRLHAPVEIAQNSTFGIRGRFKDETGAEIPLAQLNSLKLWWYALDETLTVINSVSAVSILNADRGEVAVDGLVTITMLPADAIILVDANLTEDRIMLFEVKWAAGARQAYHEVKWRIRNVGKVPVT